LSVRALERRFTRTIGKAPLHWLLLQRVRRAQEVLETTSTPVEAVAAACGFGTATKLRAHFKRHTGVSPRGVSPDVPVTFDDARPEAVLRSSPESNLDSRSTPPTAGTECGTLARGRCRSSVP